LASFGEHDPQVSGTGETRMFATVKKFWKNQDGATAIEYGLIAALIAVAAISAFQLVGTNLSTTFHNIATQL
jgi:pilus assembly protein Flp/PilA